MQMYEFENSVNEMIEKLLEEHGTKVTCAQIGIDPRSHYGDIWILEDRYLVFNLGSFGNLEYYCGFEYVEKDAIKNYGDYRFYDAEECERVMEHLDNGLENIQKEG